MDEEETRLRKELLEEELLAKRLQNADLLRKAAARERQRETIERAQDGAKIAGRASLALIKVLFLIAVAVLVMWGLTQK